MQMPRIDEDPSGTDKVKGLGVWLVSHLLPIVGMLIPLLMIASIWFDIKIVGGVRILQNGIFMIAEILIGERVTLTIGSDSGKRDKDLLKTQALYREIVERVRSAGVSLLPEFCQVMIRDELPRAKADSLRSLGIDPDVYEKELSTMPRRKLILRYGIRRGIEIYKIRNLRPIALSENMLMCEGVGHYHRRQISSSGDEIVDKQTFSLTGILTGCLSAIFFASIFPVIKNGVTWADVAYVGIVLSCLLMRMASGYIKGYRAQAYGQKKSLEDKIYFLTEYLEYVEAKKGAAE